MNQATEQGEEIPGAFLALRQEDMPELYSRADRAANSSKGRHFLLLRIELILVVLAPAAQVLSRVFGERTLQVLDIQIGPVQALGHTFSAATTQQATAFYLLPAVVILLLLLTSFLRVRLKFDDQWRSRRAVAEAVASLAWRYGMKALATDLTPNDAVPSGKGGIGGTYEEEYLRLDQEGASLDLPDAREGSRPITQRMQDLRAANDMEAKCGAYRIGRIQDQQSFYATRAKTYRRRRNRLRSWTIAAYVAGGLLIPFSGLGVMTTAAGAVVSWLAANRYDELCQSFEVMKDYMYLRDVAAARIKVDTSDGAEQLVLFVDILEHTLDGEHSTWLTQRPPLPELTGRPSHPLA